MYTVYALNVSNNQDTQTQCATLDEALCHLRELIISETEDPEGPTYTNYGVRMD